MCICKYQIDLHNPNEASISPYPKGAIERKMTVLKLWLDYAASH